MSAAVPVWYCGVIRSRICCVTTTDIGDMFALCHLLARQGHLAWQPSEMVSPALQKLILEILTQDETSHPPPPRVEKGEPRVLEDQNCHKISWKILRWSFCC